MPKEADDGQPNVAAVPEAAAAQRQGAGSPPAAAGSPAAEWTPPFLRRIEAAADGSPSAEVLEQWRLAYRQVRRCMLSSCRCAA